MITITHVWVEEGCISCGECARTCPTVFDLPDDVAVIRAAARMDGITSSNRQEQSRLSILGLSEAEAIEEAISGCPVDVIMWD